MRRHPYSIIIIGPHALLREGLTHILYEAQFRVIASAASLSDLSPGTFQRNDPISLIIESNGDPNKALSQIKLFKEQQPDGRVAVLGGPGRAADMVAAFQSGANVYFDSEERCDAFIKALPPELLLYIRDPQGAGASEKIERQSTEAELKTPQIGELGWPKLSHRENCILRCIVEGASNKVIARKIDITEATVKVHVKAILRKVRVRNRTQAAIWAMKHAGQIWHDGPIPAKGSSLPASLPDNTPEAAAETRTQGRAKAATIVDVSRFTSSGLNGNSS
jgi:two-component system, NarL family, nitrate/nitrite response regulator NarL